MCKPAIYGQSRLHWKSTPVPAIVYLKKANRTMHKTNKQEGLYQYLNTAVFTLFGWKRMLLTEPL